MNNKKNSEVDALEVLERLKNGVLGFHNRNADAIPMLSPDADPDITALHTKKHGYRLGAMNAYTNVLALISEEISTIKFKK